MNTEAIEIRRLQKSYSGVTVLDDFSLTIRPGDVHALIGHNGAGKSTVIRMLSGSELPTGGQILVGGNSVTLSSPREARGYGIYTVFQELSIIDELTVAQNMFLGKELNSNGFLRKQKMNSMAREILKTHNLEHLNVEAKAKTLSHAEKQLIEIVSSLNNDARLILLDEPTTALQSAEIDDLLRTIRDMSQKGIAFMFITHKIEEAFAVCSHVTVLRNGRTVSSGSVEETGKNQVLEYVAGRKIVQSYDKKYTTLSQQKVVLEIQGMQSDDLYIPNFKVHRGQVMGLYGLVGSGRTELLETLFGARRFTHGEILLEGRPYRPKTPTDAVRSGVLLLTEERKRNGIIPQLNSRDNMIIPSVSRFQKYGFLRSKEIETQTSEFVSRLSIKGDPRIPITRLSGGNQQKVLLARWLIPQGRLLMLDEPTKGVDIGVKMEIHNIIRRLAEDGYAILVVSSEVEEVVAVADTVVVMNRGMIQNVLSGDEISEDRLLTESLEGHNDEKKIPQ